MTLIGIVFLEYSGFATLVNAFVQIKQLDIRSEGYAVGIPEAERE